MAAERLYGLSPNCEHRVNDSSRRKRVAGNPKFYDPMVLLPDRHQGRVGNVPGIEVGQLFKDR